MQGFKPADIKEQPIEMPKIEGYKMVFLVRMDLKMSRGKIASQVGHAVISCYKDAMIKRKEIVNKWEEEGTAKIVLQTNSEKELVAIVEKAKENGIPGSIVIDLGRTEVSPNSITAGAIGPGRISEIDKYTKHLKLLT